MSSVFGDKKMMNFCPVTGREGTWNMTLLCCYGLLPIAIVALKIEINNVYMTFFCFHGSSFPFSYFFYGVA